MLNVVRLLAKRSRGSPEDSYSHFDSGFPRVDCEAKVKL